MNTNSQAAIKGGYNHRVGPAGPAYPQAGLDADTSMPSPFTLSEVIVSVYALSACWLIELPPTQKLVLIALADQANDKGECWPGATSISKRTGLSDRTIRRAMRDLEDAGYLRTRFRSGHSSMFTVPLIHTPDRVSAPTPDSLSGTPDTVSPPPRTLCPPEPSFEPSLTKSREKSRSAKPDPEVRRALLAKVGRKP